MQKGLVKLDADGGSCSKKNKYTVLTFRPYLLQAFQDAALGPKWFEHISGVQLTDQEWVAASCASDYYKKFLKTTMEGLFRIAAIQLCSYAGVT
jgi:hypothetical protein